MINCVRYFQNQKAASGEAAERKQPNGTNTGSKLCFLCSLCDYVVNQKLPAILLIRKQETLMFQKAASGEAA